jgi:hypothetical protein
MSVYELVKKLQTRPYEERMRVFWVVSILGGLLVVGVWITLGSFTPKMPGSTNELLQSWQEGAKNAGVGFTEMQKQIAEQPVRALLLDGHAVKLISYAVSADASVLTVDLEINNPTDDILNLQDANRSNFFLVDGENVVAPQKFVTDADQPVPVKILSKTKIAARATFARPTANNVVLKFTDLTLESKPTIHFEETFDLSLDGQVKGLQNVLLPRE